MLPAWMIDRIKKDDDEEITKHIGDELYGYVPDPWDGEDEDIEEEEEVLECGSGGGNPPPPPPPDPMAEAKAQMALEAEREKIAQGNREREAKEKQAKLESDTAAYQSRLGGAYNQAKGYGASELQRRGISDDYGILGAYQSEIDRLKGTIPDLDPNPGGYFNTASAFETALGGAREGQRKKLTRGYEAEVPSGYEQTYIPDTADDALINSIISEQFGDAESGIQRARDRGQLNETGFNTATQALGRQRAGAVARANELGMGVLETGRQSLRDIDKQARAGISNWDFGDLYDTGTYTGRIKSGASAFTGGLEGKLRNAFGDTEFFDPSSLIAKGGKAQGAINPGATALQDAITEEERRRTAGSVGAF